MFYQNSGHSDAPPDVTGCEGSMQVMPGFPTLFGCISVPASCKWSLSYSSSILSSNAVLLSFPSKQTSYFSSVCGSGGVTSSEIPAELLSGERSLDFDSYCLAGSTPWETRVSPTLMSGPGCEKT